MSPVNHDVRISKLQSKPSIRGLEGSISNNWLGFVGECLSEVWIQWNICSVVLHTALYDVYIYIQSQHGMFIL